MKANLSIYKVIASFETFCEELFSYQGIKILALSTDTGERYLSFDYKVQFPNGTTGVVELKAVKNNDALLEAAGQVSAARTLTGTNRALLITTSKLSAKFRERIQAKALIEVWDQDLLLNMCQDNPLLLTKFRDLISQLYGDETEDIGYGALLKQRLSQIPVGAAAAAQYEDLCKDVFVFVFESELGNPVVRRRTGSLNVRDILFSIKHGHPFWDRTSHFLRTRLLVVECKNIRKSPDQKQILQLMKYLFVPAFRTLGILCSREKASNSADGMRRVAWLEGQKLILFLNDEDLLQLIDLKTAGQQPSQLLDSMIDDFLTSLEP